MRVGGFSGSYIAVGLVCRTRGSYGGIRLVGGFCVGRVHGNWGINWRGGYGPDRQGMGWRLKDWRWGLGWRVINGRGGYGPDR